jgi:PIN domain nuclease of toxin-antitoxin system
VLRAVVDTHAVIWYLYGDTRLSVAARNFIEETAAGGHQLAISAITLAEIVYLGERGRINPETLDRLMAEMESDQALMVEIPVNVEIVRAFRAVPREAVPELPDRMIAATAAYLSLPIISRDHKIRASPLVTIW